MQQHNQIIHDGWMFIFWGQQYFTSYCYITIQWKDIYTQTNSPMKQHNQIMQEIWIYTYFSGGEREYLLLHHTYLCKHKNEHVKSLLSNCLYITVPTHSDRLCFLRNTTSYLPYIDATLMYVHKHHKLYPTQYIFANTTGGV